MSDAYIIEVEKPDQIPAAVYETVKRCREEQEDISILLDHQEEENVVRGYAEPIEYGEEGRMEEKTVRRPDGGLSWYHNNTICYMRAEPTDIAPPEAIHEKRSQWLDEVKELLREDLDGHQTVQDDGADIYITDGTDTRQVAGSSSRHTTSVDLHRSCWYEEPPKSDSMDELLERDGIDPDRFYDSIEPVGSAPREVLEQRHSFERMRASAFITEESLEQAAADQERDGGIMQGSCVLSPYPASRQ